MNINHEYCSQNGLRLIWGNKKKMAVRTVNMIPIVLCAMMAISCITPRQQQENAAIRQQADAVGVQQACLQSGVVFCNEVRVSYEQFVQNDPGSARSHIRNVLEQNESTDVNALAQSLNIAASFMGTNGKQLMRFSIFLSSVVQGNSPTLQNAGDRQSSKCKLFQTGCTYDEQCKFDRVCLNGECISARYRETLEAKYMATSKGVVAPPLKIDDNHTDIELELLPPRQGTNEPGCVPDKIAKCMKKCEKGDARSCYAVGKLYRQLPPGKEHNEYMLFAYQKACTSGLADACIDLGSLHFYGQFGERNMPLAYHYNTNACEQGSGVGCVNTARLLKSGKGVTQNPEMADEYYVKACDYGESDYCVTEITAESTDEGGAANTLPFLESPYSVSDAQTDTVASQGSDSVIENDNSVPAER